MIVDRKECWDKMPMCVAQDRACLVVLQTAGKGALADRLLVSGWLAPWLSADYSIYRSHQPPEA